MSKKDSCGPQEPQGTQGYLFWKCGAAYTAGTQMGAKEVPDHPPVQTAISFGSITSWRGDYGCVATSDAGRKNLSSSELHAFHPSLLLDHAGVAG